jgi:sirohydrochlorin ferrochelatase
MDTELMSELQLAAKRYGFWPGGLPIGKHPAIVTSVAIQQLFSKNDC